MISASLSEAAPAASTWRSGSTAISSPPITIACRLTPFPCRSSVSCRVRCRSRSASGVRATSCRLAARARRTRSGTRRPSSVRERRTWS
jgi:hypothetical protein